MYLFIVLVLVIVIDAMASIHPGRNKIPRFLLAGVLVLAGALNLTAAPCVAAAPGASTASAPEELRFALAIFKQLATQASGKNVFISPSSIHTALNMAAEGAAGETLEAMTRQLGAPAAPPQRDYGSDVTLEVANSLWANARMKLRDEYVGKVQKDYDARIAALDFSNPAAPATINQWIAERTHGKIDKLIDRLTPQSLLVLVNAIYFKGKWQKVFDPAKTHDAPFRRPDGDSQVKMMAQQGRFAYFKGQGVQAIALPYGEGRLEMIVILPDTVDGLPALVAGLDEARWRELAGGLSKTEGEIQLPRFKAEYNASLNDPLKALGLAIAFDPDRADFSKILAPPPNAYISQVKHKAVVEVTEEGTVAAAATSVEMAVTSMPAEPVEPFKMVVDHPFLCAIRDARSGELLFLGAISQP